MNDNITTGSNLYLNSVKNIMEKEYNQKFIELILDIFFYDFNFNCDIERLSTDSYGDGGVDYLFFTFNNHLLLTEEDLEELSDDVTIDIHFLQIKETIKIDSNVPNKFLELSQNFFNGSNISHYNQEIKDNIKFFNKISEKILPKGKFKLHFYYFGFFDKHQLERANDLIARFETLKNSTEEEDFIKSTNYYIKTLSDIYQEISKGHNFEYTFKKINNFVAEYNEESEKTDAVIALIPIKQYYDFITLENNNEINAKLFENNIRDYKGKSNVNKDILKTLKENKMQFWWLNNGITIITENIEDSSSAKKIVITNPQIVNGLQTSYSIFNFFKDNKELLNSENRDIFLKIIKIEPDFEGREKELDITIATNRQNEIRDKDIKANDEVKKLIEIFFKEHGKYYQRKDKYYTNKKYPKKDIITLFDMAKYINTIFNKDPSYTRNNPGKLLKESNYEKIFKINDIKQDYSRYLLAYEIYNRISRLNKGEFLIGTDKFDKVNFIHHLVYISIVLLANNKNYTFDTLKNINLDLIDEKLIDHSYSIIRTAIDRNKIPHSQILKIIKEQKFNTYINEII